MQRELRRERTIDHCAKNAALLSFIEMGMGSFLHALKIPFSGHFLSLNQGLILCRGSQQTKYWHDRHPFEPLIISNIAAMLKSLSPAGKKLTPMLAISVQGLLFNLGTFLLGRTFLGHLLGMLLLSLWAFIQPILIYYFLFGKNLVFMLEYFTKKLGQVFHFAPEQLINLLIFIVVVKLCLALVLTLVATWIPQRLLQRYHQWLKMKGRPKHQKLNHQLQAHSFRASARLALKDLFNPLFILSLALTTLFFVYAQSGSSQLIWALLRPIALGFLLFLLVRLIPIEEWSTQGRSFFPRSFRKALEHLKQL